MKFSSRNVQQRIYCSNTKLVDSDDDVVFALLPDAEHCDKDRLQRRWDKTSKEYRDLTLFKHSIDQQVF